MAKKNTGEMGAAEFIKARERLGFTQKKFADELGVTSRTVQLYEKGAYIPKKIALAVRYLIK
jgi:DNA-binding XRE family transcriptional regulator